MQAAALNTHIDYDSWLSANTGYCKRHRCRLTFDDCDRQKQNSQGEFSDLRCQGCRGLDNQPEAVDHIGEYGEILPRLHIVRPVVDEKPLPINADKKELEEETVAGITEQATPEICLDLDCLNELSACGTSFDLDKLTALVFDNGELARELQILFMGEDEEVETQAEIAALFKKTSERAEKSKRYAVYQGRCTRCGGYMDNTRENQFMEKWDDDVHRCLACGWRTSPAYAWNRENPALPGWRG